VYEPATYGAEIEEILYLLHKKSIKKDILLINIKFTKKKKKKKKKKEKILKKIKFKKKKKKETRRKRK